MSEQQNTPEVLCTDMVDSQAAAVTEAPREPTTADVIAVIERVGRGLEATRPNYGEDPVKKLTLMAKRMKQLAEIHEALDSVRKELNGEYDRLKLKDVPDLMLELEMRTYTVDGVGRVQISGDVYASIPADRRDAAYAWLRENNYGDLIQETVNSSTFKAFCKEGIETGREIPEDLFKVTPYTKATLVKARGKAK